MSRLVSIFVKIICFMMKSIYSKLILSSSLKEICEKSEEKNTHPPWLAFSMMHTPHYKSWCKIISPSLSFPLPPSLLFTCSLSPSPSLSYTHTQIQNFTLHLLFLFLSLTPSIPVFLNRCAATHKCAVELF